MKLSGYISWGKKTLSMIQLMTLNEQKVKWGNPPLKKNYFKTGNFFQLKNLNLLSLNFNQNLLLKNVNYFSTQ